MAISEEAQPLKSILTLVGIITSVTYVFGVITQFVYLSGLGVASPSLLRTDYFAAGIYYCIPIAASILALFMVYLVWRDWKERSIGYRLLMAILSVPFYVYLLLSLCSSITRQAPPLSIVDLVLRPRTLDWTSPAAELFKVSASAITPGFFALFIYKNAANYQRERGDESAPAHYFSNIYMFSVYLFCSIIYYSIQFGTHGYPNIPRQIGGGGSIAAQLTTSHSLPRDLLRIPLDSGATPSTFSVDILYQDDSRICFRRQGTAKLVQLSMEDVVAICVDPTARKESPRAQPRR